MLKNRTFFLFLLFALNMACQSVAPDAEEKETKLQKIIESNISYAQKQIDLGKTEHALQTLRPILKDNPDSALLQNMVGITYLALSRPAQAKIYFNKAYQIEKNPAYALNLSSALIALNSLQSAERLLIPYIQDKDYQYIERMYHNYALIFEKRKNYKKAIHYYNLALDENPSYYLSNLRLAKIYQTLKQSLKARTCYEKAYQSCRVCYDAVSELSLIYIESGEYSKATSMLGEFLANKEISDQSREEAKKLLTLSNRNRKD